MVRMGNNDSQGVRTAGMAALSSQLLTQIINCETEVLKEKFSMSSATFFDFL
jgi:hypothetical protein